MNRRQCTTERLATLLSILAAATLIASGCQKAQADAALSGATNPQATTTAAAPTSQPSRVPPCSLLSAAEVGAIMEKKLVQSPNSCDYGLDPSEQEQQFAKRQSALQHAVESGDMSALMSSMSQGAGSSHGAPSTMDQVDVKLDASRDDQTEEAVKAIYAQTGRVVRSVTHPEKRGLNGVIQGFHDIDGVGDWAFATNVAALNMGLGFSERGRILEARKGPWHVTVSATVAPDPGAAALDVRLANLARALLGKL